MASPEQTWVLLSGGIGGARLALGLDRVLPRGALTVIANTGDDFRHLGLAISPDLDTLMYTLGDTVNTDAGWGCRDESWQFMESLERLGGETWFRLGDRDLATHIERTRRLAAGERLADVTRDFCRRLGIGSDILPMSDDSVATKIITAAGELDFQDYFVRQQARPRITGLRFHGADTAAALPEALDALADPRLQAIIIAPSNPWLSIEPILSIPVLRKSLRNARVPVVAISPIVGGAAIKGPTGKIMGELGMAVNTVSIARHYRELVQGLILDVTDAAEAPGVRATGMSTAITGTIMRSLQDRTALARFTVQFAAGLKQA